MSDYLDIQLMDSLETRKAHPVYTESASCLLISLYANLLVCILFHSAHTTFVHALYPEEEISRLVLKLAAEFLIQILARKFLILTGLLSIVYLVNRLVRTYPIRGQASHCVLDT